jgi:hypothetical protein
MFSITVSGMMTLWRWQLQEGHHDEVETREKKEQDANCGCLLCLIVFTSLSMLAVIDILLFVNVIPLCSGESDEMNVLRTFGIAHFAYMNVLVLVACCKGITRQRVA